MLKRTVIQASAGTGKTFRLAQRVLERVASGTPIGCIVVVTFTVAATAELNARVRARLSEAEVGLRARAAGAEWAAPDETLEAFVDSPPASALQNIRQALVDFDEGEPFSFEHLDSLLGLARSGIKQIVAAQNKALK